MIEKGFEYAYKYGEPRNADSKRYRVIPKCCKVGVEMVNSSSMLWT